MMSRRRLAHSATTILLTSTAAAGLAGPAHASADSSPEQALDRLYSLLSDGEGGRAYDTTVHPSCRNPADRRDSVRSGDELEKLGETIFVGNYRERVDGRTARVSFTAKFRVDGRNIPLQTLRGTRWVRIDGRWYWDFCSRKQSSGR